MIVFYTTKEGGKWEMLDFINYKKPLVVAFLENNLATELNRSFMNLPEEQGGGDVIVSSMIFPDGEVWDAIQGGFRKVSGTYGEHIYMQLYEIIVRKRRSGRTTRLADQYIQELFEKGEVVVIDHHGPTKEEAAAMSEFLTRIILRRISFEHPHIKVKAEKDEKTVLMVIKLTNA